jgi:hypothetical protein
MSPIFSSAEPGPQLTWTAMIYRHSRLAWNKLSCQTRGARTENYATGSKIKLMLVLLSLASSTVASSHWIIFTAPLFSDLPHQRWPLPMQSLWD